MQIHDPRLVEFLEELQRSAGRVRIERAALSSDDMEALVQRVASERGNHSPSYLKSVRRELLESWEHDSPSAYEPPWHYSVLKSRFGMVDRVARQTGHEIKELPLLGTLDTGLINAMCVKPPDAPGYLLLFESQMFAFCNAATKAFVNCLPAEIGPDRMVAFDYSVDAVSTRLRDDADVRQRLLAPIIAYAVYGNLEEVPPFTLGSPHVVFDNMLRVSMECFVTGHEYGHLMAGHLDSVRPYVNPQELADAGDTMHSWGRELVADLLGIRLAMPAAMTALSVDPSVPLQGAVLFFLMLDLMDRAVSFLDTGAERRKQIGSHPPATERLVNLLSALPSMFAAHDPDIFQPAILGAEQLMRLGDVFWNVCRPRLEVGREMGFRPWPGWRLLPPARPTT